MPELLALSLHPNHLPIESSAYPAICVKTSWLVLTSPERGAA
jgi:hypothetical protein